MGRCRNRASGQNTDTYVARSAAAGAGDQRDVAAAGCDGGAVGAGPEQFNTKMAPARTRAADARNDDRAGAPARRDLTAGKYRNARTSLGVCGAAAGADYLDFSARRSDLGTHAADIDAIVVKR